MILKVERNTKTAERNSTTCECIFHQFAVKNVNVKVVITIYCQHNWIFLRQKKIISIHYLTGQNRGLSGLKNIWPVIMTGNLLSVICSPAPYIPIHHHTPLYITIHLYTSPYIPIQHHIILCIPIHPYTFLYTPIQHHIPLYNTIYPYTTPYTLIQHHILLYITIQQQQQVYGDVHGCMVMYRDVWLCMVMYRDVW